MADEEKTPKRPGVIEPLGIQEELPLSVARKPRVMESALVKIEKALRPERDE